MKIVRNDILKHYSNKSLFKDFLLINLILGISNYLFYNYDILYSLLYGLLISLICILSAWHGKLNATNKIYKDSNQKKTLFELFNHY